MSLFFFFSFFSLFIFLFLINNLFIYFFFLFTNFFFQILFYFSLILSWKYGYYMWRRLIKMDVEEESKISSSTSDLMSWSARKLRAPTLLKKQLSFSNTFFWNWGKDEGICIITIRNILCFLLYLLILLPYLRKKVDKFLKSEKKKKFFYLLSFICHTFHWSFVIISNRK